MQIGLRGVEYGWEFGDEGIEAPDALLRQRRLKVYPFKGPAIGLATSTSRRRLPERGIIDLANLANNWIRFDAAQDIPWRRPAQRPANHPVQHRSSARRFGVNDMPKMFVKMKANPLFDGVRVLPPNFVRNGNLSTAGSTATRLRGQQHRHRQRYNFDLPDSNFFFPGDVIHDYIEAQDNLTGDVGAALLPADTTGFGEFEGVWPYGGNSTFIVRGLPTLSNAVGDHPQILFWNDFANRGGQNEWYFALNNLGLNEHIGYDVLHQNDGSPTSANGLGGRTTAATLAGYDILLYTCGDLGAFTISNNDYGNRPSNDIGVLSNWFQQGGKKGFFTGDDLMFNLGTSGAAALALQNTGSVCGFINNNILPLINNQTAPVVKPVAGNGVFRAG